MPETTTVRPGQTEPQPINADMDLRVLLVAALRQHGELSFIYEELGEAAVASLTTVITVEREYEGVTFRLVQEAPDA
jgi:hypothetical protein